MSRRRAPAARCSGRGLLAVLLASTFTLAAAGAVPERAAAHAAFVGAQPAAGEQTEASPREVALSFTEPLNGRLSRIEVLASATGKPVRTAAVNARRSRLSVRALNALPDRAYIVRWFTVSTGDDHAPPRGVTGWARWAQ